MSPISMFAPINQGDTIFILNIVTRILIYKHTKFFYIFPIDKWSDVQKSLLLHDKIQKMNISKQLRKQYRTDVSSKSATLAGSVTS
jgi:hypothetical protein